MKCLKSLVMVLAVTLLLPSPSHADDTPKTGSHYRPVTQARISYPNNREIWVVDDTVVDISEPDGADVFVDIPFRIIGIAGTVAGAAFFIGTSPLTGLFTAFPPHNAIMKSAETFVVEPVRWTFQRPIGVGPTMPGGSDDHTYGHFESRKNWNR